MSAAATSFAWSLSCSTTAKLFALAFAEQADDDGRPIYQDARFFKNISRKTGMGQDMMDEAAQELIKIGAMSSDPGDLRLSINNTELMTYESLERKPKTTSIYLMANRRNGLTKIGRSENPRFREATLQSEEPEIEMIAHWESTPKMEELLHIKFQSKRVRGEWFQLSEEDIFDVIQDSTSQRPQWRNF